jgi:dynein heavy chain
LATKATRWPLCIDPQLQAVNWIKKKYEGPLLKTLNMNEGPNAFIKDLENTIKRGGTCLFENIDEELDPTIDPLLEKNIVDRAGQKYIKLTDNFIDYNEGFKLYFTTKLSNPKYTPEIMGKTMVINFTVTLMGLRDQLLNVVVSFEKPEKERQRKELIHQMSVNRKKLKEAEDELLNSLSESSGSLLENEPLIETLESTKRVSIEITEDIEKGEITSK